MQKLLAALRGHFNGKPGSATWKKVIRTLNAWPEEGLDELIHVALPYCREHLLTWSKRTKNAPPNGWMEGWAQGDAKYRALVTLAWLNESKHPDAGLPEFERCSYYRYEWAKVEPLSNNGDCDIEMYDTYTSEESSWSKIISDGIDKFERGMSCHVRHYIKSYVDFAYIAEKVSVVLNGVTVQKIPLIPDVLFNEGQEAHLEVRPLPYMRFGYGLSPYDLSSFRRVGDVRYVGFFDQNCVRIAECLLGELKHHPLYAPYLHRSLHDAYAIFRPTTLKQHVLRLQPGVNGLSRSMTRDVS